MDPNIPDPNNPSGQATPASPPQPDLGSAMGTPPLSNPSPTPLPDLNSSFGSPPTAGYSNPSLSTPPALSEPPTTPSPFPDPFAASAPMPSVPPTSPATPTPIPPAEPASIPAEPTPTFTPPGTPESNATPDAANGFAWPNSTNPATSPPQTPVESGQTTPDTSNFNPMIPSQEPAPSDLSHLVNPSEPSSFTSAVTQPETLATSPAADVPNIPTEGEHKGIPKWLIGVGVGVLLAVAAASAYFILGIGKNTPAPESAPATNSGQSLQAPPTVQTSPIPTIAAPTATSSAGFGTLPGGGSTPATSAADLLRQRQGQ